MRRPALLAVLALIPLAAPAAASAQESPAEDDYFSIQWWHPLAAGGVVATLFLVDEPIQEFWQDHQGEFGDDLAEVAAEFHAPEVFVATSVGAMSLGLVLHDSWLAETGVQILAAYGLSSGMMITTKWIFGRSRPSETPDDVTNFDWFNGGSESAFPSGAAAVTFSLATTLADQIDNTPVTILLYSAAALNSWSRVYTDKHWFSDVALGALYGISAAKIVNGRWRVFGWKPPTVGVMADGGVSLGYSYQF